MVNTRSINKDDKNNIERHSSPSASDTRNLRTSGREAPSKMLQGPSSRRLVKRTLPSPAVRRQHKRLEPQNIPSPLRRSGRINDHSSMTHLDPKSSGSSGSKQEKLINQKSVKQPILEAKEVCGNEKHKEGASHGKRKRMDARAFRSMLKSKAEEDRHKKSTEVDKLTLKDGINYGAKIADCFNGSYIDCKAVSNCMLPSSEDNAKEMGADSRLTGQERGEKLTPSKRKGSLMNKLSDICTDISNEDNCTKVADAASSRLYEGKAGSNTVTSEAYSKRIRLDHDPMVSCNTKESVQPSGTQDIVEKLNILAPLDPKSDHEENDALMSNSNHSISELKQKLPSHRAYSCKSDSFRFVEYWVPVQISLVQLEQYCATLVSNSSVLCSSARTDLVDFLHDLLISTRKCCNHPYVNDLTLQTSLTKGLEQVEYLDIGIKASGKLYVLDSMLTELKKEGLRGLVLFQSIGGSGKDVIGDILDDFLRQRFGSDSYERVDKCVIHSKKLASVDRFNNKDGRFVFLLETSACSPSIKLSSIDTIIIFASDWNPMSDIKSLHKIKLDSQFECIKIFRLYSSFTVEEKALILAKQDKTLDSNLRNISRSTCHMLLTWGVSCLFDNLRVFHEGKTSSLCYNFWFEDSEQLLKEAVREFSSILLQDGGDNDASNCSMLLKVQLNEGKYSTNSALLGERKLSSLDEALSHMFWTELLRGKNPQWRYSSGSTQRSCKKVQHFGGLLHRPNFESVEMTKKCRKVFNNVVDQPPHFEGKISSIEKGEERPQGNQFEYEKLKQETAKLCEILLLPDNVKTLVDNFLKYIMNNHCISLEPVSILQAFQLSVCWSAASLLKHKIDHKASLMLVRQHLNFECRREEADYVYSLLRCLKKIFLYSTGTFDAIGSLKASELPNKVYSSTGVAQEIELAVKDISKSIKQIQKRCQKKLRKLLLKQQEEKNKLSAIYEDEKAGLGEKYKIESAFIRYCTPNDVMRSEKLKILDQAYAKRIEELKSQHGVHLTDLEAVQLAARQKFQCREAIWVEAVKYWAQDELDIFPSMGLGIGLKYSKTGDQGQIQGDMISTSSYSKEPNSDEDTSMADEDEGQENSSCYSCSGEIVSLVLPSSKGEICDAKTSSAPCGEVAVEVHKTSSLNDDKDEVPSSRQGEICGAILSNPGCALSSEVMANGSSDGVNASLNSPSSEQQTCGQILIEVSETSHGVDKCHNGREHQTDAILLDKTNSSDLLEGVSRTMNDNSMSQETPLLCSHPVQPLIVLSRVINASETLHDPSTSLFTSSKLVDEEAGVGEVQKSCQQVEPVFGPVDELPHQSNNEQLVMETQEQVQQLPSTTEERRSTCQQVEVLPSQVNVVPATQSNHDSLVMDSLQQVQQLHSEESPFSNQDTTEEIQNTSQEMQNPFPQVESVTSPVDVVVASSESSRPHHESQIMEHLRQGQELQVSEHSSSNQNTAEESQNCSLQVQSVSSLVDLLTPRRTNSETQFMEPLEHVQKLASVEISSSNQSTAEESQNCSLQVQSVSSLVDLVSPSRANSEMRFMEPLEHVQKLASVEISSSIQNTAEESQNRSLQVQSVSSLLDLLTPSQTNSETRFMEPSSREPLDCAEQLASVELSFSNQYPLPLANGTEHRQISEDIVPNNVPQASIVVPQEAVVQHDSLTPGGFRTSLSDTMNMSTSLEINNHPTQAATQSGSMGLPPLYSDPLENEIEKICKEINQAVKDNEDTKVQLQSDCEKELEEVRRKYDIKLRDIEVECQQTQNVLRTNFNLVLVNQKLAEAFRSKCTNSASGMQKDARLPQQLVRHSGQQSGFRSPLVTGSSSGMPPPAAHSHYSFPPANSQNMASSIQAAYNTTGVSYNVPSRPPHANALYSPSGIILASGNIHASDVSLQPYRSLTYIPTTNFTALMHAMHNLRAPGNIPATSLLNPQLRPTYQLDPYNRGYRPGNGSSNS